MGIEIKVSDYQTEFSVEQGLHPIWTFEQKLKAFDAAVDKALKLFIATYDDPQQNESEEVPCADVQDSSTN